MKLAKFPKTFELTELQKGYFPHLFNTDDHQTYVRSLPDQHYYMPDGMSVDDRDAFRRWHAKLTHEGYVFDFRRELLEYCKSDVLLLKQGCMTFKREFEAKAGFDPFYQMTIASACKRYLRTHCLQPNIIACELLLGWGGRRVNQSPAAFSWLAWEAHLVSSPLRHAHNGSEVRPLPDRRYTVDGFDAMTQTIYAFDGCFWHGCPTCFPQRHEWHPRLLGRTMDDVFALRQQKHDLLRQHGYLVRSIWECGHVDVPLIPPSKPFCKRTRPLALSIRAIPSSVDVPTPTNSTGAWKMTDASSSTISRACTLTSTNTAATPSVIPRSSLNHPSNKGSTRI